MKTDGYILVEELLYICDYFIHFWVFRFFVMSIIL